MVSRGCAPHNIGGWPCWALRAGPKDQNPREWASGPAVFDLVEGLPGLVSNALIRERWSLNHAA